jgi:STE24 endopeptidase
VLSCPRQSPGASTTPRLRHILFVLLALTSIVFAETTPPPTLEIPAAARPGPNFDVKAATDAWLATVPADKKARSDSYFEGGYWLQLWDFLVSAAIMLLLLQTRLSARMRDWAERVTKYRNVQTLLYFIPFFLITALLQFPFTVYEGFFREHQNGLSNQTFGSCFAIKRLAWPSGSFWVQSPS